MLGRGTKVFISEEDTYGVMRETHFTDGISASSASYDDMIPFYNIPGSRPSWQQNTVRKNLMVGSNRRHVDMSSPSIGEVSGSYSIGISSDIGFKKMLSLALGNTPVNNPGTIVPQVDVKSMTVIQTIEDGNKNLVTQFLGMCIDTMSISVSGLDSPITADFSFLGQRENYLTTTDDSDIVNFFDTSKFTAPFNDVYPTWTTKLELGASSSDKTEVNFYDLNFSIGNSLSFENYREGASNKFYHSNKPIPKTREVSGTFTLVGSTGDTTKEDNLITLLNNLKQNNVNYVKIWIYNDKLNKNYTIEFPKVYFISGGVFDNLDFGELKLPLGFIAEGSASEHEVTIKVNDS